ncbi:MAG: enoyl-CoA hydratase/isomerase family protein [Oceanococcus sp.]
MSNNEQILYRVESAVAVITLNRPGVLNALTPSLINDWEAAIQRANDDPEVGAILVTGEGKAFCAGADLEDWFLPFVRGEQDYIEEDQRLGGLGVIQDWIKLTGESKPLVAAVQGAAIGGGITMLLPFDVIYAADNAVFSFPFAKVGIVPEYCSSHFLAARVGLGRASEWTLSGRMIDAEEAARTGLINHVTEAGNLLNESMAMARSMAKVPTRMAMMTKSLLRQNFAETDISKVWQRESDTLRQCFGSSEHHEAVQAFLASRSK